MQSKREFAHYGSHMAIEVFQFEDLLSRLIISNKHVSWLIGLELVIYKSARVVDDAELFEKLADLFLFY